MAGLYIHIPFCKSKCHYCDFHSETGGANRKPLVDALCAEMELRRGYAGEAVGTLYVGGGTPSLLTEDELRQILAAAERNFHLNLCMERTVEVNPDDISDNYARMLKSVGFDRVSVGVQSFSDKDLRNINRRHTARQAVRAVESLQNAGFRNISIDLIFGLPEQTLDGWQKNLQTALALGVQHISGYSLSYEENTVLWKKLRRGEIAPAPENLSLEMFRAMSRTLAENGFEHYEISNFARPDFRAKHNANYWNGTPYVGIGPAAHSYNGTERRWNVRSNAEYVRKIQRGETFFESETLTADERYNDLIITALRTKEGISVAETEKLFGEKMRLHLLRNADRWLRDGKMELRDGRLRLSGDGIFISDSIFADLIFV